MTANATIAAWLLASSVFPATIGAIFWRMDQLSVAMFAFASGIVSAALIILWV